MSNPLVLTIDFGTQSVRVGLVNKQGEIVALEKVKYEPAYKSPKPGYAEQDPEFYFKNLCTCKLGYYEEFTDIKDAIVREKQIKGGSRKKKLDLIMNNNPDWVDLYEQIK